MGDRRLAVAITFNMLLTVAQVIGGIVSGSLSLIADALHNFSDASSLIIALVARKIGRRPADHFKTFGYKRAEVIAALINLVTLVLIGLYLMYEAVWRIVEPAVIEGWTVVIVAVADSHRLLNVSMPRCENTLANNRIGLVFQCKDLVFRKVERRRARAT